MRLTIEEEVAALQERAEKGEILKISEYAKIKLFLFNLCVYFKVRGHLQILEKYEGEMQRIASIITRLHIRNQQRAAKLGIDTETTKLKEPDPIYIQSIGRGTIGEAARELIDNLSEVETDKITEGVSNKIIRERC